MSERTALSESWRRFRRHRLAMAGVVTLALIVLAVLLAGLSPYDPATTNLRLRFAGPSPAHPFGTDDLGRDTLTRVLYGGRVSLLVGVLAMLISVTIGTLIGALAGFFVVPMNALLQHRGHVLMSAGHSIAVQNFNENLNILLMLGLYSLLVRLELGVNVVIVVFGAFVTLAMVLIIRRHHANQRVFDSVSLIGQSKH